MRRQNALRAVAIAAVLAAGTAACGDDAADDAAPTSTTEDTPVAVDDTTTTAPPDETTTTTPADVPADDELPDDPGDDDGRGDPLVFVADLAGDTEVPGPGDDGASGRVEIESAVAGEWCLDMEATGLSAAVTDSHIHFGPAGSSGDVVIPIGKPTSTDGDTDTWTDVCVTVADDLVAEVIDAPDAFYANIHTADFGGGAIRGQLELSSIFDLTLS
ncbi:CHRD domain-containing protein [Actinospongicola halichondriae]|uniref:CHRD domain-containing protein n=1 Tax=Actinospongicola halichondriae TaxID=3236844 RepID=UPI003D41174D